LPPAGVLLCPALLFQIAGPTADPAALLPQLPGWATPRAPGRYGPENLYEYIDGAADGFLECDFQELLTQVYEAQGGGSLTVELYRQADPDAAYGVYSQERPVQGRFLSIGAEGYYEKGILNFLKGTWYVKLSAFGLGELDREQLEHAAKAIAGRITGPAGLPAQLRAFPKEGQVPGSQRYLRRNVLGYPFLQCAFTTEYKLAGQSTSLWIFAPPGATQAGEMLAGYLRSQGRAAPERRGHPVTLVDQHHGTVSLLLSGTILLGAVGGDRRTHEALLERLRAGLVGSETAGRDRPARP
jgi:hypothetical protein